MEKQVSQQLESIQDVAYQIRSVETFMRMKSASKNNTNKSMQDKSKNKSKDALDNRSKSILDRNKKNKALAISKISA